MRPGESERTTKTAAASSDDHGRVVRHRREAQCLGEELVDPLLVVALVEEQDRGERRDHPEQCRPVTDQTSADG